MDTTAPEEPRCLRAAPGAGGQLCPAAAGWAPAGSHLSAPPAAAPRAGSGRGRGRAWDRRRVRGWGSPGLRCPRRGGGGRWPEGWAGEPRGSAARRAAVAGEVFSPPARVAGCVSPPFRPSAPVPCADAVPFFHFFPTQASSSFGFDLGASPSYRCM